MMAGPSLRWVRLNHAAALAVLLFGLAATLTARANFYAARKSLSTRFRLTVALQPALPQAVVEETRQSIAALPSVAAVHARDPRADAEALFSSEPWAAEYRDFLGDGFLPQTLDVALRDPYGAPRALEETRKRIQSMDTVSQAAYARETYERTRAALALVGRVLRPLIAIVVLLTVLAAASLEYLCLRLESQISSFAKSGQRPWLLPRLLGGIGAGGGALGMLFASLALVYQMADVRLIPPSLGDVGLLLAVGVIVALAAGAAVRLALDLAGSRAPVHRSAKL